MTKEGAVLLLSLEGMPPSEIGPTPWCLRAFNGGPPDVNLENSRASHNVGGRPFDKFI